MVMSLTTKWVKGALTREEVAYWLRQNLDNRDIMLLREDELATRGSKEKYDENFEHLLHCLWSIYNWYTKDWQPGHFLTAILKNDLSEATSRADSVNVKMLDIYAKFLYNVVPDNYKEKIKK